jgi:hypothetical protein
MLTAQGREGGREVTEETSARTVRRVYTVDEEVVEEEDALS